MERPKTIQEWIAANWHVDMLDSIAIFGTAAEARDRIAARKRLPQLRFHSPPSFMVSPKRVDAYSRATIQLLGSSEGTSS